jgi:hypothetical protein
MRIVVFGPTGKAGREAVRQAFARGHHLVAYTRNPAEVDFEHGSLTVVQGVLGDTARLEEAIAGAVRTPSPVTTGAPIVKGTMTAVTASCMAAYMIMPHAETPKTRAKREYTGSMMPRAARSGAPVVVRSLIGCTRWR